MRKLLTIGCVLLWNHLCIAADWFPYPVESHRHDQRIKMLYAPLAKASNNWSICVSLPHLKDAYWLAVNFGVSAEAKRQGVSMNLVEAGGYSELQRQRNQIEQCVKEGAKAVIIGAISADGLNDLVKKLRQQGIVIIDLVNGMTSTDVSARSLVSYSDMAKTIAHYIVANIPEAKKMAWFPGPTGAGWVVDGHKGMQSALVGSHLQLISTRYADTGLQAQRQLLLESSRQDGDIDLIVGTAVTAEAAIPMTKTWPQKKPPRIVSYYFTPGVYFGIKRGQILAAPTDSPVIQARIAIDQAIRILEKQKVEFHVSPNIVVIDQNNVQQFDRASALAPEGFDPVNFVR